MIYVRIDLHKKNVQIAVVNERGKILTNRKILYTRESIRYEASYLPKHAKYVVESPPVREDTYCYVTKELGLDVMVSNPIHDAAHCKVEEDRQGGCGCAGGHA